MKNLFLVMLAFLALFLVRPPEVQAIDLVEEISFVDHLDLHDFASLEVVEFDFTQANWLTCGFTHEINNNYITGDDISQFNPGITYNAIIRGNSKHITYSDRNDRRLVTTKTHKQRLYDVVISRHWKKNINRVFLC